MSNFPQSAPVKKLDQQHPEYAFFAEAWSQIGTLFQGGVVMREAVLRGGQFLVKNTKELPEVFATRQLWSSYTNLLGNIIGWYVPALFKQPPQYVVKPENQEPVPPAKPGVAPPVAPKLPGDVAEFCEAFEKDCDRSGTSLTDFFARVAEACLQYKSVYVVLDTPGPAAGDDAPLTLQAQQDAGLFNPFLVLYSPSSVINWETDSYGNLEWATIKIRVQDQQFLEEPAVTDYWYYFDRQQVALYERQVKQANAGDAAAPAATGGEEMATLAAGYPKPHAMTQAAKVPIHKIALPEGLWLANRVFAPLCNHFNQDNALDFGLMQANLPQLTITDGENGVYEENPTISAVGYHHLPYGATMTFLEPEGRSYEAAQKRIDALEERIYKACYLMDQARSNRSTPTAQSGASKQMDKTPSRDALSGIGDVIRAAIQSVYQDALIIAQHPEMQADVRGFDFADKGSSEDMALLESGAVIPINSQMYEREVAKRVVRIQLPDLSPEALAAIDGEIDTNPTPSAVALQQQEEQNAQQVSQFTQTLKASAA